MQKTLHNFFSNHKNIFYCFFLLLISTTLYFPGLFGDFLLDDYGNLNKLGDYNGIRNLDTLVQYLSSGIAGPTGRPLSLLSFLIDSTTWPADPFPFKRSNLILHNLNGLLLFFIVRSICEQIKSTTQQASLIAFVSSALWLWHPFQVSTVLYVVQRMAMLSTFFSLIGVLLYCQGRRLIADNKKQGYTRMTLGVVLGTVLGVFSKENGALLPLLLLCLEVTAFSSTQSSAIAINKHWRLIFLIIPSALIIIYLLSYLRINNFDAILSRRDFSQKQRLLTESRLLIQYLYHLLIPQMYYSGIFNESIPLSTSLLKPITTLPSVILVFLLPLTAIIFRKKQPFLALAILFFFGGHLLESSTISLELYFEHRNYLPSLFIFLPIAVFCQTYRSKALQISLWAFLFICLCFTFNRAALWGNPTELSLFWAKQNKDSVRAQRTAALTLSQHGRNQEALNLLAAAKKSMPEDYAIKLHWAMMQCQLASVSEEDFADILRTSLHTHYTSRQYNLLEAFIHLSIKPSCSGLDSQKALLILDNLSQNPHVAHKGNVSYQFNHFKGVVYLNNLQPELAYNEFKSALNKTKRVDHGLVQAALLASHQSYELALKHLEHTERLLPRQKIRDFFSTRLGNELTTLRNKIEQNANRKTIKANDQ